jgi:hypothetical protein
MIRSSLKALIAIGILGYVSGIKVATSECASADINQQYLCINDMAAPAAPLKPKPTEPPKPDDLKK